MFYYQFFTSGSIYSAGEYASHTRQPIINELRNALFFLLLKSERVKNKSKSVSLCELRKRTTIKCEMIMIRRASSTIRKRMCKSLDVY
ncbi:hypothetical protein TSAR_004093 [Trichomalopsis sarcophagae]|uniref:Uncharacterized protein n=1 Tax=Trichomalopsis sarcophagae TaxID=543379 RepID=A0A232ET64_9HYME|nr:hypothetical protein TSAR_004093 [Trichomalopsis sarcophagae]